MKKILLFTALSLGFVANAAVNVDRTKTVTDRQAAVAKVNPAKINAAVSVKENPEELDYSNVKATVGEVRYYGDINGEGYGGYYVTISTTDFTTGLVPTSDGMLARIMVYAPLADDADNFEIPVGEYVLSADKSGVGTIDDYNSGFLDVSYDAQGEVSGYLWSVKEGSKLVISKNEDGTYSASFTGAGQIYVSSSEIYNNDKINVSFSGNFSKVNKYQDPSKYKPLGVSEYKMNIPNASGRYDSGDYSLALYGCELDNDGFIVGAGDLFNTELIVNASNPVVEGEYTCFDLAGLMNGTSSDMYGPGNFLSGYWYAYTSSFCIPIGTSVQVMDEYGDRDKVGLAKSGNIKVTRLSDGNYTIDIDFMTFEDTHVTGSWTGDLKNAVLNFPEFNGINDVTVAAGEAVYYNLQGVRVAQPENGVYIKVVDGKATKVAF